MEVHILLFGKLAEIAGTSKLELEGIRDSNHLVAEINKRFPELSNSSYRMAVNQKLISENTMIDQNTIIALLPPFSGG